MASVTKVETVENFCNNYDRITVTNYPNPAKVRRGSFKKGDFVIFDEDVPRHAYKGHYFYGRIYTCREWSISNPVMGQKVETMSEDEFWNRSIPRE